MPLPAGDCLQTMGRSTICLLIVFPLVAAIIEGRPTVRRNAGGESPNPITFLPDAKFPAVSSKNRDTRNTAVLGSALSDGNANRAATFIPNEEFSLEFGNMTSCGDGMCRCNATYADCSKHGANLTYVPQLPPGVTFLNFSYNRALINYDNFFMNVTDIKHLELGNNRLKFISHGAFLPLKKLQRLNLGLNPLTYETLAPALSVKTLIKLVLIGLGLGPLPDDLFHKYPLSHLEELLLYGNSISRVNMSVFAPLNNLKQLLLGSNKIHQIHSAYLPQVRYLDLNDCESATSFSINAGASGILDDIGMISGKFSTEYQYMASKQVQEKSFTTRAQVRYVRYKMQLQPDTPLHPTFRGRLLDIAAAHTLQEVEQADYMAQLLVRDFGTHVITGVQAGAALLKIDHLSRSFLTEYEGEDFDFRASAGASLFGLLSASMSLGFHFKQDSTQKYDDARTSTQVRSLGGPIYQPNNFTMDTWAKHVDENLVALDRSGAPLHTFVTTPALPELPPSIVQKVSASVQKAVVTYYTFNRIPGCLDVNSPSFSLAANYDDGSCKPPATNETFGGVYQTCEMTDSENGDLCGSLVQTNPLTGDTSCPPSYRAVPLHQGTARNSRTEHQCHSFLSWKWHCHDVVYQSTASYSIYWCVADQPVPQDSGYLFGGLYTTQVANPVTQRQSCPPSYLALAVGSGLRVCVSDDFVAGADSSVPFGGFFSCTSGNPLAAGVNKGKISV
ncbi:hypothetical protein BaRGS_00024622 [Batillaria attramentaria]|uniref:MACPF domain-containing protein n=1 Tax=Batillaria attramentaria TaxID=370345 RepID=A0ABD0KAK1_9CAEN